MLGLVVPLVIDLAPAGAGGGRASSPLAPAEGALFGAYVGPAGKDPSTTLTGLEGNLGRRLAIDHSFRSWATTFPDGREQWDVAGGRIPMISWGGVPSSEINAGLHDKLIRTRAQAVDSFGQPLLIRWFPGMAAATNAPKAGTPGDFVTAWHRLRRIFTEEGAANAVWVWCPDATDFASGTAPSFYPGDEEVDWTCADGSVHRHRAMSHPPGRPSFEEIFTPFYTWGQGRPKAMMVTGYGVEEGAPGEKAAWVDAAREALKRRMPGIAAVVYHSAATQEGSDSYDWRMETSDSSLAAFSAMGGDPWFRPPIDTTPGATINSGPEGMVNSRSAIFSFSTETDHPRFECRLNGAAWRRCVSPQHYAGLADRLHVFEVRAISTSGRPDPRAARREWIIDTAEPEVVATSPGDGASNVSPHSTITATFSEPLDPATMTAETFTLTADPRAVPVKGRIAYEPAGRRARFSPDQQLLPFVTYRATITAAVEDLAGNRMRQDHVWLFQTGSTAAAPPAPTPDPAGARGVREPSVGWSALARSRPARARETQIHFQGSSTPAATGPVGGFTRWGTLEGGELSRTAEFALLRSASARRRARRVLLWSA